MYEVCETWLYEEVRAGMAWHYKDYQHEQPTQERLVYGQEEENAKASRVGLWKDAKPVPPWEWRAGRGSGGVGNAKRAATEAAAGLPAVTP